MCNIKVLLQNVKDKYSNNIITILLIISGLFLIFFLIFFIKQTLELLFFIIVFFAFYILVLYCFKKKIFFHVIELLLLHKNNIRIDTKHNNNNKNKISTKDMTKLCDVLLKITDHYYNEYSKDQKDLKFYYTKYFSKLLEKQWNKIFHYAIVNKADMLPVRKHLNNLVDILPKLNVNVRKEHIEFDYNALDKENKEHMDVRYSSVIKNIIKDSDEDTIINWCKENRCHTDEEGRFNFYLFLYIHLCKDEVLFDQKQYTPQDKFNVYEIFCIDLIKYYISGSPKSYNTSSYNDRIQNYLNGEYKQFENQQIVNLEKQIKHIEELLNKIIETIKQIRYALEFNDKNKGYLEIMEENLWKTYNSKWENYSIERCKQYKEQYKDQWKNTDENSLNKIRNELIEEYNLLFYRLIKLYIDSYINNKNNLKYEIALEMQNIDFEFRKLYCELISCRGNIGEVSVPVVNVTEIDIMNKDPIPEKECIVEFVIIQVTMYSLFNDITKHKNELGKQYDYAEKLHNIIEKLIFNNNNDDKMNSNNTKENINT